MADCDDYEGSRRGARRICTFCAALCLRARRAGGRWRTLLMNWIDPALFSFVFTAWVRQTWPDRPALVAIDGKTSRRGHDRAADKAPLHLASTFARPAGSCLVSRRTTSNEINA